MSRCFTARAAIPVAAAAPGGELLLMKVLMFHNRYRQLSGENLSTEQEAAALRAQGVEVVRVDYDNDAAEGSGWADNVRLGWQSAWSRASHEHARRLCAQHRPDVAHMQNFWMRLTPSVHAACQAAGVPTVQTLRNYRLVCTNALLLRNGQVCEDCLGKLPWRGVVRRCYRDSLVASAAVGRMIVHNRLRQTWQRHVDAFLTPSEHSRSRFVRSGLSPERIFVKPNCVEAPATLPPPPSTSDRIVYLGRLSAEKGLEVLLAAWKLCDLGRRGRLMIVGEGDERASLERQAAALGLAEPRVSFAGHRSRAEAQQMVQAARAVVLPSLAYETFGRPIVEAFAAGRPAVVSNRGAPGEIVDHGQTGLKFHAGDERALAAALNDLLASGELADRLGGNARRQYLSRYTPECNFEMLMRTYRFAMERRGSAIPARLQSFEAARARA